MNANRGSRTPGPLSVFNQPVGGPAQTLTWARTATAEARRGAADDFDDDDDDSDGGASLEKEKDFD